MLCVIAYVFICCLPGLQLQAVPAHGGRLGVEERDVPDEALELLVEGLGHLFLYNVNVYVYMYICLWPFRRNRHMGFETLGLKLRQLKL